MVSGGDQGRLLRRGGVLSWSLNDLWLRHSEWQRQVSKGRKARKSEALFTHPSIRPSIHSASAYCVTTRAPRRQQGTQEHSPSHELSSLVGDTAAHIHSSLP